MRNLRPAFTQAVYGTRMDSYRLYWDQKCLRRRKKKKCQINRNIIDNLQTLSFCTGWTIKSTVALQVVVLLFRADLLLTMKISPVSAMQTYHNYIQGCFEILDVLLNITCVIMYFTIGSLDVNMSNFTSEDQQRTPCCKTILCRHQVQVDPSIPIMVLPGTVWSFKVQTQVPNLCSKDKYHHYCTKFLCASPAYLNIDSSRTMYARWIITSNQYDPIPVLDKSVLFVLDKAVPPCYDSISDDTRDSLKRKQLLGAEGFW